MAEQRTGPSAEDVATAVRRLQAELTRNAGAISRVLDDTAQTCRQCGRILDQEDGYTWCERCDVQMGGVDVAAILGR